MGFLLKEISVAELEEAMKLAVAGGAPLSPAVGGRVVRHFHGRRSRTARMRLTQRERQVLDLLCSGASYREVARVLGIAEGTVQTYVKSLYEKLESAARPKRCGSRTRRRWYLPGAADGNGGEGGARARSARRFRATTRSTRRCASSVSSFPSRSPRVIFVAGPRSRPVSRAAARTSAFVRRRFSVGGVRRWSSRGHDGLLRRRRLARAGTARSNSWRASRPRGR